MADRARYDVNSEPTLLAVSNADGVTPVLLEADPSTHALLVSASVSIAGGATEAKQDVGNASLASIDTKTPALGQALAAASVPIVLTAAQLITLTPPTSVTANAGTNLNTSALALESGGNLATLAGAISSSVAQTNLKQVNGVTTQMGTGAAGTGTQRVAVASDSSIVLAAGANTIGALTANQSVNVAQMNGVAVTMNNGAVGTGVQRVTLASDSTGQVKLAASSGTDIGALTANQSVNNAQINGVSPLMGNGITGTGSQRVTVASDNTPFPVKIDQTTPGTTNAVTDTKLPASAAAADALANPTITQIGADGMVFNGTTWDRSRSAINATNSIGTGITAVGLLAQLDDTSPTVPTENQFANLRMSADRGLLASMMTFSNIARSIKSAGLVGSLGVDPDQVLAVSNYRFNNNLSDTERGNEDNTLLASGSRTTTQTSADITNPNGISGLIVVLDMTVVGTGSVTLSIKGKDVASGKYYTILAGAAVTTNTTNVYRVGPNIAATANLIAQDYLPRTFQILVTANNANAATYSVGYSIIRN